MNSFQRKFINEVKRCEDMERKLRFFESEIVREKDKEIRLAKSEEFVETPKQSEIIELEVKNKPKMNLISILY